MHKIGIAEGHPEQDGLQWPKKSSHGVSIQVTDSNLWAKSNLIMHEFRIKLPNQYKRLKRQRQKDSAIHDIIPSYEEFEDNIFNQKLPHLKKILS